MAGAFQEAILAVDEVALASDPGVSSFSFSIAPLRYWCHFFIDRFTLLVVSLSRSLRFALLLVSLSIASLMNYVPYRPLCLVLKLIWVTLGEYVGVGRSHV